MGIIEFIRDRARFYNCPVCGRSLKGCEVQVLSHEDESFRLQVTCAQCQVTFIVVLAIAGGAMEGIENATPEPAGAPGLGGAPSRSGESLDPPLSLQSFHGTLTERI